MVKRMRFPPLNLSYTLDTRGEWELDLLVRV
jgi:hypothetical protein